jgi:uncharacterized Zn finger protein (UPF0148 family)
VTEAHRCPSCGAPTVYQAFSGGREFYCPGCGNQGIYPDEAPVPPRVAMLRTAEGREQLRRDARAEAARRRAEPSEAT